MKAYSETSATRQGRPWPPCGGVKGSEIATPRLRAQIRKLPLPDCTLSGARTKKAMETAVHVDRGRSTITWKTLRVYAQFPQPRRLIS